MQLHVINKVFMWITREFYTTVMLRWRHTNAKHKRCMMVLADASSLRERALRRVRIIILLFLAGHDAIEQASTR